MLRNRQQRPNLVVSDRLVECGTWGSLWHILADASGLPVMRHMRRRLRLEPVAVSKRTELSTGSTLYFSLPAEVFACGKC